VNAGEEGLLRERFAVLGARDDGDWDDVRHRARRRSRRVAVLVAALAVALVVTGFGLGGQVLGLFDDHGKPVPLSGLSEQDLQTAVFSLCRRIELVQRPGRAPLERCRAGVPKVEEIANNGAIFYWKLSYPDGMTCLASGPVGGHHDPVWGDSKIGMLGCNAGAPTMSLVPTPKRPITTDISFWMKPSDRFLRIQRASGLAGAGVASVGLVAKDGSLLKTPVKGRTYDFGSMIPVRRWVAIVAYDDTGNEVYRRPVSVKAFPSLRLSNKPSTYQPQPLPPLPAGKPQQHGETTDVSIDVYPGKVVAAHFTSTTSEVYRRLMRGSLKATGTIRGGNLTCGDVAYGAGTWRVVAGGADAPLRQDIRVVLSTRYGGFPSPPYDFCEITGLYGRYWNDEEGTHDLVEVPFTPIARRFLDERATARDLAYFVRTRKMWRIRKAVHRGESAPTAAELARLFGPRVVPMEASRSTAPVGQIGVWSNGHVIVATERAPDGRRLFVTVRGVLIGATNIRRLSFVF
jgi:hypothetical protein